MFRIRKKQIRFEAYRLGDGTLKEQEMMDKGFIRKTDDGYRIFSQEIREGYEGEHVKAGDYFIIDSSGRPYPNNKDFFEAKNIPVEGHIYTKKPAEYDAYRAGEESDETIRFAVNKGILEIDEDVPGSYFRANVFGTVLTGDRDAVIVIYGRIFDENGMLKDVDLNIVAADEFCKLYDII